MALETLRRALAMLPLCCACAADTGGLERDVCAAGEAGVVVELAEPCDQRTIEASEVITVTASGTGIDPPVVRTIERDQPPRASFCLPATPDLELAVRGTAGGELRAVGDSGRVDLSPGAHTIEIELVFADDFYTAGDCTGLNYPRHDHTATWIEENGLVWMLGGASLRDSTLVYTRAIEAFDPREERMERVDELRGGGPRGGHTTTFAGPGTVLVAGGTALVESAQTSLRSALLVDVSNPTNVRVDEPGLLAHARTEHTATRFGDGRVLIAGGIAMDPIAELELWDPATGAFSSAGRLETARAAHSATLLPDGEHVLVAGGFDASGAVEVLEVVHVTSDRATVVARLERASDVGAIDHTATLLPGGGVALAGGFRRPGEQPASTVEVWTFDAATGALSLACRDTLAEARAVHTADQIGERTLLAGGMGVNGELASAELLRWAPNGATCFAEPPLVRTMATARWRHTSTLMGANGRVLITGGLRSDGTPFGESVGAVEIFVPRP